MLTRTEPMKVIVQGSVQVGTSKPIIFGWEARFQPTDRPEKIAADIADICRRLHEDAQGAVR